MMLTTWTKHSASLCAQALLASFACAGMYRQDSQGAAQQD